MPSKIIKESNVRAIFKDRQMTQDALDWLDEYIDGILEGAYNKIKNVKQGRWFPRIDKELLEFAMRSNSIIVMNGDSDDDEEGDGE